MTENEEKFWLDSDNGIRPYLRMKGKGMPQNKINQIAWLLLNSSGCGFCKVCREESCNIKDGEKCTINIANYIRKIVLEEYEGELQQYRSIGTASEFREAVEKQIAKKPNNKKELRDFNGKIYSFRGDCPICGEEIFSSSDIKYCHECGQRLDWSD